MSEPRLSMQDIDPHAISPLFALEKFVHDAGLGEELLALVKIRASQINGCAHCLDMHGREARAAGVSNRRLDVLAGWPEAPQEYSDRERAALALTESMTLISQGGVPDSVWNDVKAAFTGPEITALLMAVCAINVWNRLAVTTHQDLPDLPVQ